MTRLRLTRRGRAALPPLALVGAALAAAAACSETATGPSGAVAIAFDSLPAPAVVVGDTLRDAATGLAAPLTARAFDRQDRVIPDAPFTFFSPDTTHSVTIVPGNFVVAGPKATKDTVAIIASLGNLQLGRGLFVVPKPDILAPATDSLKTTFLVQSDTAVNVTDTVAVRVLHGTTPPDTAPVRGWVVRFRIERADSTLADSVRLSDASGRLKTADTTDASGVARVWVRVFAKTAPERPIEQQVDVTDTVIVAAEASYRGQPLTGSPVRRVVPLFGTRP